ncbi:MAG: hypothetical protein RIB43_16245 [Rhodospirillaceae bacterium]
MPLSFDILGFGSKRKSAFQVLDREWVAQDIDIRPIDGGIRQLLYIWAQQYSHDQNTLDSILEDIAKFSGFLMRGPELSMRALGNEGVAAMSERLEAALHADGLNAHDNENEEEPLDVRVTKLILAVKLADRDIEALISLEDTSDS